MEVSEQFAYTNWTRPFLGAGTYTASDNAYVYTYVYKHKQAFVFSFYFMTLWQLEDAHKQIQIYHPPT